MVPTSGLSKALTVPWPLAALHKEAPAVGAPLLRSPKNAPIPLQFVLRRSLQGAI